MKAQMKAIMASAVVIALCLAAVGGVTYSWFSDTEESEINVSTAKIDIEGQYTDVSVKTTDGNTATYTTATITNNDKDLTISNMMADRVITATYKLTNHSTVNTTYRMYAVLDGIEDLPAGGSVSITCTQGGLNCETITFDEGIAQVVGSLTTVTLNVPSNPQTGDSYIFEIKITFNTSVTSSDDFSVKIVNEAYQTDATLPEITYTTNGSAPLTSTAVDNGAIFRGEAPISGNTNSANMVVTVPAAVAGAVLNDTTGDVSLKVNVTDNGNNDATVSLEFENSNVTSFNDNYVTVEMILDGTFTSVTYLGTGSQPVDVTCVQIDGKTKVTFKTNHFSDFQFTNGTPETLLTIDEVTTISTLASSMSNSANNKTITLLKDIAVSNNITANGSSTIDGQNHIIYSTYSNKNTTLLTLDGGDTVKITNATIKSIGRTISIGQDVATYGSFDSLILNNVTIEAEAGTGISAFKNSTLDITNSEITSNMGGAIVTNGTIGAGNVHWNIEKTVINSYLNPEYDNEHEIYMAIGLQFQQSGTMIVKSTTFNITQGIGISVRGGDVTIYDDCIFNHVGDKKTTTFIQFTDCRAPVTTNDTHTTNVGKGGDTSSKSFESGNDIVYSYYSGNGSYGYYSSNNPTSSFVIKTDTQSQDITTTIETYSMGYINENNGVFERTYSVRATDIGSDSNTITNL